MAEGYTNRNNGRSEGQSSNQRNNSRVASSTTAANDMNVSSDSSSLVEVSSGVRPPCRYFKRGSCQYGENCRFAHCDSSAMSGRNMAQQPASTSRHRVRSDNLFLLAGFKPVESTPGGLSSEEWVNAPEFVPSASKNQKMKSYAEVLNPVIETAHNVDRNELKLCPYGEMNGVCNYSVGECSYLHGEICELCGNAALHPYNNDKRKKHIQECIQQHEKDMELSFAVARSKEKSCGVCFEVIMEKSSREQRFGILPNCNHCFCLTCIRKWRQARQFDNKIIRACPECRVTSDFVCPSMYWVDTKDDKEKLITDYKGALSQKDCKYFKQGHGKCPFGNKCFYLHALPDGTKTDVGPPPRQPRRANLEGEYDVLQQIILWDFLDDRENRWLYSIADDLEDLVGFFSDSEDSDWSEYDFFFD